MKTVILKICDISIHSVGEELAGKLANSNLYEYADTVHQEHMYPIVDTIYEDAKKSGVTFTEAEQKTLQAINDLMNKHTACYFRILN
jgi:hypothetical protein